MEFNTCYDNDEYSIRSSAAVNTIRSNISYQPGIGHYTSANGSTVDTYNTWNDPGDAGSNNDFPITNPVFKSTTPPALTGTGRARLGWYQTLVDSDFLKLDTGSPCIGAAHDNTDVGADQT